MTDPAARLPALREAALERLAAGLAELGDVIGSAGSTTGDDEHDPEGAAVGDERLAARPAAARCIRCA